MTRHIINPSAPTVARIALALPRLADKQRKAHAALHRYCERYGYGKPAHARHIAAFRRADSAYSRAYNLVLRTAGYTMDGAANRAYSEPRNARTL